MGKLIVKGVSSILLLCITGCTTPPPSIGVADRGHCDRLAEQYHFFERSVDERKGAKPGIFDYDIGLARCRDGRFSEGVEHLAKAVRAFGITPVS